MNNEIFLQKTNFSNHFLPLKNKHITLGVCASIAIYKSLEILRMLQKLGANVSVVLSPKACKMINPIIFEALSNNKVLTDKTQSWSENFNHITQARTDAFIIAPITANSINKISHGIADNVLLESFLASLSPKLVAPAANSSMLENPITQKSLDLLQNNKITIIPPSKKVLVCKEYGSGALASPFEISMQVARSILKNDFWDNRLVCINGGGSKERLDSVRYISNLSSGKQASSLAIWAYLLGAKVTFISSAFPYQLPLDITTQHVSSTQEYSLAIHQWKNSDFGAKKPYFFGVAAISDYTCSNPVNYKLKKDKLGKQWHLTLEQNKDLLQELQDFKGYKIGFKVESLMQENLQEAIAHAQQSRINKGLNAVCLNTLTDTKTPFGSANNEIFWCDEEGSTLLGDGDKFSLANLILKKAEYD